MHTYIRTYYKNIERSSYDVMINFHEHMKPTSYTNKPTDERYMTTDGCMTRNSYDNDNIPPIVVDTTQRTCTANFIG